MIPAGLGMMCTFPLMGPLVERFGWRTVSAAGAALALAGTLPFAWTGMGGLPAGWLCLALFVRGAGQGGIGIPSIAAAYHGLAKARIPVATTTLNIVQRLGGPMATTLLAIFLHLWLRDLPLEAAGLSPAQALLRSHAFSAAFGLLALLHAATLAASLHLPRRAGTVPAGAGADAMPAE